MKKQVKLYLSHEAVEMVENEKRRTTLPLSTIVELLIRQHLTNGGVVPVKEATSSVKDQPAEAEQEQEADHDEGEASLDEGKGYIPYY